MTVSICHTALPSSCQPKPRSVWARLGHMIAIAHQRRQLLALDDHLLKDIGVSREQARAEVQQPAWNAPDHWRK